MVKAVIITGLAGCGKTLLSLSLHEWFKNINQDVAIFNLDPGARNLPYTPDIDVREFINLWDLMDKYSIGPNGALILSMDLLLDYIEKVNNIIGSMNPKLLIIDTPGQMEYFAYRQSSKFFIELLNVDEKLILFVLDGLFVSDARNLISNLLVYSSLRLRFEHPSLLVLNKLDLLSDDQMSKINRWFREPFRLYNELVKHYSDEESSLFIRIFDMLRSYRLITDYIPISSVTLDNIDILVQGITRVLFGGEEFLEK
jgi:hypothetical protein